MLLAVAEALADVADAVTKVVAVAELELWMLEGVDEGDTDDEEGEAELTALASTTSEAALPLAEEEEEEREEKKEGRNFTGEKRNAKFVQRI